MPTSFRPFPSSRGWVCAVAVLGGFLLAPAGASAAAPVCPDATFSVHHDQLLSLPGQPCTGGTGTLHLSPVDPPHHGHVVVLGDGTSRYGPDKGFVGDDSFSYMATDDTAQKSNVATVTIHVTDTAPTCQDTSTTTPAGRTVDISNLFVVDDTDDSGLDIGFGDGDHGVTDDAGTTYTPDPGFVGVDHVPFQADDGALRSRVCFIAVDVKPVAVIAPPPVITVPPPDVTPPVFSAAHPKQSLADARSKGVRFKETSNEAGTLTITIKVDKATARKLKIKRGAKRAVTVGALTTTIQPGATTVAVKLSAKARKALKAARKVKLLVSAEVADAAGNVTSHAMTVTLKR